MISLRLSIPFLAPGVLAPRLPAEDQETENRKTYALPPRDFSTHVAVGEAGFTAFGFLTLLNAGAYNSWSLRNWWCVL
jgi:hypothetical protein